MAEPRPEPAEGRARLTVSVILPTYLREELLVDTLRAIGPQLEPGDEILVIDQSPTHRPEVQTALAQMHEAGKIRWIRKRHPNQGEAMNVAALLATGDVLLFLDDDIIPSRELMAAHRSALAGLPEDAVTVGQVLQPWHSEPVSSVKDFELGFDFAFDRPCEIRSLIGANFALRRTNYLAVGGMDENFRGSNYRNDAELAWRVHARTGRLIQFVPQAALRHLLAPGGNRGFGGKDSWGNLGGATGDYYFALKWLPWPRAGIYMAKRLLRAPVSRATARRPWRIPSLFLRELVGIAIASFRLLARRGNYVKALASYDDLPRENEGVVDTR